MFTDYCKIHAAQHIVCAYDFNPLYCREKHRGWAIRFIFDSGVRNPIHRWHRSPSVRGSGCVRFALEAALKNRRLITGKDEIYSEYWDARGGIEFGPSYCNASAYFHADFSVPVDYVSVDLEPFVGSNPTEPVNKKQGVTVLSATLLFFVPGCSCLLFQVARKRKAKIGGYNS